MSDSGRKPFPFIKIIFVLLVIGLFTIIGLGIYQKDAEEIESYRAPVVTVKPLFGKLDRSIHINGYIQADEMVTLSPRISGTVLSLEVEMGDSVGENDFVLLIDPAPYELTFLQAQAAFLTAESTFTRIESLYRSSAATVQSYDEARAGFEAARSSLELARLNLDYTRILSPISGTVLETHVNRGALAGPGTPLLTIGDLDSLTVNVRVPERHYSLFMNNRESMEVFMEVPALEGREVSLEIDAVSSHIEPDSGTFLVKCRIPPENGDLRPGMFVKAGFILESREVYHLPFRVTAEGDTLWYVDTEGRAAKTDYNPASYRNEDFFAVAEDYSGTSFIIEGQHFISPGSELNVIEERTFAGAEGDSGQ